jgi:outer membrane protein assembly factor BamE (lipoprotein component of BamABCDE complex)
MASTRERKSCSSILALVVLLAGTTWGCTIGRVYIGSEFKEEQQGKIVTGATTKSDILTMYGPPDTVRRQYDGDVFLYRYLRRNSSALDIAEPVVTHLTLFSFSRLQQKDDSLMILFDKDGVVKAYGSRRGTSELTQF